jgi:superfamily I DNA and/or RNA helicase
MQDKYKPFRIYLKGEEKTDEVCGALSLGEEYEITFNSGRTYKYKAHNVRIVESALNTEKSRDRFEYLKSIADAIGLKSEVEPGKIINILANNYSKIDFVAPNGMLAAFLRGQLPERGEPPRLSVTGEPVYPFGFNASQKSAVDKALSNQLSIIEGPPGTGKTQTILNIIANVVMRGESVAVVSSNNSATMNVLEKLRKYGVDFIAAYLGNSANKKEFINAQKPLPDITAWALNNEAASALGKSLSARYVALCEKLAQKNILASLKRELSALETEQKHFLQYSAQVRTRPQLPQTFKSPQQAIEMWLLCETYEESRGRGIIAFIKNILEQFGIINRSVREIKNLLEKHSRGSLVDAFQRLFYELKITELTRRASETTYEIESFDFDAKMREYAELSMRLFRGKLSEKYGGQKRGSYELNDLWRNSEAFIADYPVILSTAYSLRSSLSGHIMYDYVIVDESSQVDLCTGALALSCARKTVIVGDLKQLPNVVDSSAAALTDAIFAEFDLPEVYRYRNHSLLSAAAEMFADAPQTLLREHYRCHPKIIDFCNKKFYDNRLIILTEPKSGREPLMVYKTTAGNHERNRVNQRQIDVIKTEIIPQQNIDTENGSVGIVTPYRNQTDALQNAFTGTNVKADTVDKFQGQENEIIILSTVDNEISEFADNANRLNVAISRAIAQLIVVVSDGDVQTDTNIGDLVRYIEYNNFSVVESAVYSVFDYLYKSYAERRYEFLKKQKRVSEYDSENLMYALIAGILKDERFACLAVAVHVPLKMIIRDTDRLSPSEKQYVANILTHVDFLIFDTIGMVPRLVVEVDGAAFHSRGTRQSERDAVKNAILGKYGLPVERFRTDGSGERERLIAALRGLTSGA